MHASIKGHLEICTLLVEKGADLNMKDKVSIIVMCICVYGMRSMCVVYCMYVCVMVTAVCGMNGCGE